MNLATPESSRIVRKIIDEQHLCWTSDCPADGAVLQAAIEAWADLIDFDEGGVSVDESLSSTTLTLGDGTEDVGLERYEQNLIAKWDFKEGAGLTAFDVSGVAPSIDLGLQGEVTWLTSWGIQIDSGSARALSNSRKLYDRIADVQTGTGQYTVEAWVVNASTALEGPARLVRRAGPGPLP